MLGLTSRQQYFRHLRNSAIYRRKKVPDDQLSIKAQSSIWEEASTFWKSTERLPLIQNKLRETRLWSQMNPGLTKFSLFVKDGFKVIIDGNKGKIYTTTGATICLQRYTKGA